MTTLTTAEVQALLEALEDEHKAWATYDQVIIDFGPVRPFINIRDAEARHINALTSLFDKYQLAVPPNPWPGKVTRFETLPQACAAAVSAEIANKEMYDRLISAIQHNDILVVLRNLQDASQHNHLPAFQRCANITSTQKVGENSGGDNKRRNGCNNRHGGRGRGDGSGCNTKLLP